VAVIAVAPIDCTATGSTTAAFAQEDQAHRVRYRQSGHGGDLPTLLAQQNAAHSRQRVTLIRLPNPGQPRLAASSRGTDVSVRRLREGWIPRGAPTYKEAAGRLRGKEAVVPA
jgi:hypothetical protein